ncbi:hypothetical protein EYF80_056431 [Liparis tanakae]|uniref:Uncharacterized protein n=1 Tax=Liparis tanakae TaxID=230148 RepID=A0A4Z2EX71_9TELE|nr:hypothetical protein EYF80_056431 [Liparis tanakae]
MKVSRISTPDQRLEITSGNGAKDVGGKMDFCERFGPEIAYCLRQPLCGGDVNITCVCECSRLFPWGVMAVECCGTSVKQAAGGALGCDDDACCREHARSQRMAARAKPGSEANDHETEARLRLSPLCAGKVPVSAPCTRVGGDTRLICVWVSLFCCASEREGREGPRGAERGERGERGRERREGTRGAERGRERRERREGTREARGDERGREGQERTRGGEMGKRGRYVTRGGERGREGTRWARGGERSERG